jgi:small subunit ribosomal protein S11
MNYLNITIKSTENNLILTLSSKKNKILLTKTLGQLKLSKSSQKNPLRSYVLAYKIGRLIRKKKIKSINVSYKGWNPKVKFAINGLKGSGLTFKSLTNKTNVPFNGCRLKKKKR